MIIQFIKLPYYNHELGIIQESNPKQATQVRP